MVSQPGQTLIGRQREMEALSSALDEALEGRGRVVMLAGEPGIGKTRLAQELAYRAESLGAQVLWGWCYEQEGAPPYWPWVQPIRYYISVTEPDQLRDQLGPGAADIAEVIPELRERLPGLEPPPVLDPNQARFRLFDSFSTFFKNAARTKPLVLVLDDLHWADKPSLLLLEFLAQQISEHSLMVVGTYRDAEVSHDHPLFETLAQFSRVQSFHRQTLGGLTPADVGEFILATNGSKPSQTLIDAVHAHTEGNPFFINEVIQLLVERGEMEDGASIAGGLPALAVPQGVVEVIGQRLNRLSKECNDLLTTAAVIGRQFDFNLLAGLTEETTETALLGMVDEALDTQIIHEVPDSRDRYQFSHALVQQTLLARISTSRRVRLHAKVGEVLETLYDQTGEHAAELAYHFDEASPVVGSQKLVKYTLLAGERELEAYAPEEALGHFIRGLVAKGVDVEGSNPVLDAEAAALMFGLGRAQAATLGRQHLDVAYASLNRAFNFYAETNDVDHAVGVAAYPLMTLPGHHAAMELMTRALSLVPPDSPEAGRLLSRYLLVLGLEEGDYQAATEAFDGALAIAQRTGDLARETRTLVNSSFVDFWHLRWPEAISKGLRVIELSQRGEPDQLSEVSARFWVGVTLQLMGDSKGAQPHALAMLSTAESLRDRYWLATAFWLNEMALTFEGDLQAAKDYNERGLSVSPSDTRLLVTRMRLEHEIGNKVGGHVHLERLVEALRPITPGGSFDYASTALMIPVVARITGDVDQLYIAEKAAASVISAESATPFVSKLARLGLGLMAVVRGDAEAAREQYIGLGSADNAFLLVSGQRVLGLLAHTMGDLDQAESHFEEALSFCRKAGYGPELGWTCHDYADALTKRNNPGDRARALGLLGEALSISEELGMRPLAEQVRSLKDLADSGPSRPPAYPAGLTEREIDVIRLLAGGRTDREIAEELIISVRTASTHVANILNKTGAANRAEAASFATRHGLD